MMEDIAPKLLDAINNYFNDKVASSDLIQSVYEKLKKENATYLDANDFAIEVGTILADAYKSCLSSKTLPDGRMYFNIADRILNETLGNNYNMIAEISTEVQRQLNRTIGIGLNPVVPKLQQKKIKGLINRVSNEEQYDKIAWILDEPVKTFSQSIVDDFIKANAEFHGKAGLQPKIVRRVAGNCCDWCANLAGSYNYPDVPKDVYRRHERCRCTVDYDPGNGKIQNVHNKEWRDQDYYDRLEERINNDYGILRFNSAHDPMEEVMGPAIKSHPKEVEQLKNNLKKMGVDISHSQNLGYGCTRRGVPGTMSISDDASYSAWLHEYQHVLDDRDAGWNGAYVLFCDPEERMRREINAYNVEIALARKLGREDMVKRLEVNLENEIARIRKANE